MSYFNEEQEAHMRDLAAMPAAEKCSCGWYRRGECPSCSVERGGFDRCGASAPLGWATTCTLKKGHSGDHLGFPPSGYRSETWPNVNVSETPYVVGDEKP